MTSAPGDARDAPPSPLDPGVAGWHLVPRAWRESPVYRTLKTAEARHVAELILFSLPRYQDEEHWFGASRVVVRRGQLFHTELSITRVAGARSRKVVRTVIRKLIEAGLIGREKVHESDQCPHLITVRDYDLSQTLSDKRGQRPGQRGVQSGASEGPERGPKVTELKEVNETNLRDGAPVMKVGNNAF